MVMKSTFIRILISLSFIAMPFLATAQYSWKLLRNEDGIKIFESEIKNSELKAVRVECVIPGTYNKLMALLRDVSRHSEWVYSSKSSRIVKKISANDFYYYTETVMPWPLSNRDAVVHLVMKRDSLDRYLRISATSVGGFVAEKSSLVRVKKYIANWYVTMPTPSTLSIIYTIEADPGGNIPGWLANEFADKGPFESFKKLGELLKR